MNPATVIKNCFRDSLSPVNSKSFDCQFWTSAWLPIAFVISKAPVSPACAAWLDNLGFRTCPACQSSAIQ